MTDEPDFIRTIPIEDVGFVLLENQQISITLPLLNALADNNAAVEKAKPETPQQLELF